MGGQKEFPLGDFLPFFPLGGFQPRFFPTLPKGWGKLAWGWNLVATKPRDQFSPGERFSPRINNGCRALSNRWITRWLERAGGIGPDSFRKRVGGRKGSTKVSIPTVPFHSFNGLKIKGPQGGIFPGNPGNEAQTGCLCRPGPRSLAKQNRKSG